jgi:hypothetical protein
MFCDMYNEFPGRFRENLFDFLLYAPLRFMLRSRAPVVYKINPICSEVVFGGSMKLNLQ